MQNIPVNPFKQIVDDDYFIKTYMRMQAFMHGEVADRPPVSITFWEPKPEFPIPYKDFPNERDRWMDVDYTAELVNAYIANTVYYSDAFPSVFPNLGPEIFTACCGAKYNFGPWTTWTEPMLFDWKDADKCVIDPNNEYYKAVERYTQNLITIGKDRFAVGMTDLHAGADHLAALRDPQTFCMDLYDYPDEVKAKLASSYDEYFKFYNHFYDMIHAAGRPTTSWLPYVSFKRFNMTQCDFSCMISVDMFLNFFYDWIQREHDELDESIYHLDGPDALKFLDYILDIKKLNAIQWVFGAGNEGFDRWIPVYQKIQKAHKGIWLPVDISELDSVFANLKPDGVWFSSISGISDRETADCVLKRISNWK